MGRGTFGLNDVENYGSQGGGGFFKLVNDHDVAKVRVMYESPEDVEGYVVHEVQVDGRKRYVKCLRDYNEPVDNCPFCKAGMLQQPKYFIPLYDLTKNKVLYWERGRKFTNELSGLLRRTPRLVTQVFEIERNGKPRDTSTTYKFWPMGNPDNTRLADLPKATPVIGGIVMDKSYNELETYLQTGSFPEGGSMNNSSDEYRRRTPSTYNNSSVEEF